MIERLGAICDLEQLERERGNEEYLDAETAKNGVQNHTIGGKNHQQWEEAQKNPIVFDEDCEKLSPAMMKAFKSAVVQRNRKKKA